MTMTLADTALPLPSVLPVVALGALVCLLLVAVQFVRNGKRLPPGPRFPGVENFNAKAGRDPNVFLEWRKRWGEISSTRVLHLVLVSLNSHRTIDDVLVRNGEHSNGRFPVAFRHHDFAYEDGIIGAQGETWKQRKGLILNALRQLGYAHYEQPIESELQELVSSIGALKESFNPLMVLNSAVSNVICRLLFGDRVGRAEMKRFEVILARVNDFVGDENYANNVAIQLLGNVVMLLPGDPFHARRQYQNFTDLSNFIGEHVARRRAVFEEPMTCLLDALIADMRRPDSAITERQIRGIIADMLIAGMETTTTTLRWALLLMAKHRDVQQRVQREIHEALGGLGPTYADRSRLMYTQAVLHEVERFITVVPLSIPHVATASFDASGFLIPKNAVLISNLYAAHHDTDVWPDALNFNPSNFYDEKSNSLINYNLLVPFGAGRRSCLGECLARQELFVFFSGLLRHFDFLEDPAYPLPDVNQSVMTVIRSPKPFRIVSVPRL